MVKRGSGIIYLKYFYSGKAWFRYYIPEIFLLWYSVVSVLYTSNMFTLLQRGSGIIYLEYFNSVIAWLRYYIPEICLLWYNVATVLYTQNLTLNQLNSLHQYNVEPQTFHIVKVGGEGSRGVLPTKHETLHSDDDLIMPNDDLIMPEFRFTPEFRLENSLLMVY